MDTEDVTIKVTPVKPDSGWGMNRVEVFYKSEKVAEYTRSYPHYSEETFYPFIQKKDGEIKMYALFSERYDMTSVMELPSGKVIASTETGFCSVDFMVPYEEDEEDLEYISPIGLFGFVAGCLWGSSTWEIRHLDLSRLDEGVIEQTDRYKGIEFVNDLSIENVISMDFYEDYIYDGEHYHSPRIGFHTLEVREL